MTTNDDDKPLALFQVLHRQRAMSTTTTELKAFFRKMTVEQLTDYRAALGGDLKDARRQQKRQTIAFCVHRRRVIAEVLAEKGAEARS